MKSGFVVLSIFAALALLACTDGKDASPLFSANHGSKATAFGDSITLGYNASSENKNFARIIADEMGWTLSNRAQSGSQIAGEVPVIYSETVEPDGNYFILTGFNDMRNLGTDNAGLAFYRDGLADALAWLAIPDREKVKGGDDNVAYRGTWFVGPGSGRQSSQHGDTAEFTVAGRTIYIASLAWYGGTGSFSIAVDGESKGEWSCATDKRTASGLVSSPFLIRLSELRPGPHRVVLAVTSRSGIVNFDWAAGERAPGNPAPRVYVGNSLRMLPAGYQVGAPYYDKGSDEAVAEINRVIREVCDALAADGFGVYYVDACAAFDPKTEDVSSLDSLHPSDQGMAKIAAAFLSVIRR